MPESLITQFAEACLAIDAGARYCPNHDRGSEWHEAG